MTEETQGVRGPGDERHAFLLRLGDAIRPLRDPIRIQAEAMRVLGSTSA
jgi:hypothetical protein